MKTPCLTCDGLCCQDKCGYRLPHKAYAFHAHECPDCDDGFVEKTERIVLTSEEFNAMVEEIQRLRAEVAQTAPPHPAPTATDEVRRLRDGERVLCPDCGFYFYSMRTTGDGCRNCKERQP